MRIVVNGHRDALLRNKRFRAYVYSYEGWFRTKYGFILEYAPSESDYWCDTAQFGYSGSTAELGICCRRGYSTAEAATKAANEQLDYIEYKPKDNKVVLGYV